MRATGRLLRVHALPVLLTALAVLRAPLAAADPLDPKAVPEPLKPWAAWVLDGNQDALCATVVGHADASRCVWPSRLDLALDEQGGRFTQGFRLDAKSWAALPGDDKRWPTDVKVDGEPAIVITYHGGPAVELSRGDRIVTGSFGWSSLPESLQVPSETGLLTLALRGAIVAAPNRDSKGVVWLQKAATNEEGDALEFVVHRKVKDDIPLILETHIELHVAGKNREDVLGRALPAGFVPMELDSPLPARIEPDGHLRVQLRPGVFVLRLFARSERPVRTLSRPAPEGPWREGDEVWVFEARNDYRVVTVEGAPSIDPQQTTLPDSWKRLPAYPMKLGTSLTLVERRRGDADPPPNQLSLDRALWLDFDGTGYTVSDKITGALHRDSRLTMAPPTVLGRVSIGGTNQFITRLSDDARGAVEGVEVRQGQLDASADSRIAGDPGDIPAVSWAHDFHQVTGSLHLPPGWRLVHASGVDEVPNTWVREWSLLELFLALIASIGVGRLYGLRWGAVALAMLVLTLPEADAPKWSWLVVLAAEALFRVMPAGTVRRVFAWGRALAIACVAVIALPFLVQNVREGMYPALANAATVVGQEEAPAEEKESLGAATAPKRDEAAANRPAPPPPLSAQSALLDQKLAAVAAAPAGAAASASYRQSNAQVYDPSSIVQTGPGLPRWRWTTLALRWTGPVAATQRLRLYLLSPAVNLVLALARAALLLLVVLRVVPRTGSLLPKWWPAAAAAIALSMAPASAHADLPSADVLKELRERLLRRPDCVPTCAASGRMSIEARGDVLRARLEVDESVTTAVPLPGKASQWTPGQVLVDGTPAKALARQDDGLLYLELAAGHHQVALEGPLPDRESIQLSLPLKPHRVEATAVGWTIAGLHEDGLADDDLQLTRVRVESGKPASLVPGALPPFVRVERTLSVGLSWQVDTRIVRVTPAGSAVVLEVPLLPGESVTTADVRVVSGKALVNMGPQASEAGWHSVLEQKSPVRLTAPESLAWVEIWRVDVGPIWHASYSGIPFVHTEETTGVHVPEWRPWPGETGMVALVRPEGVSGQTLTIDESSAEVQPGLRAIDVTLRMTVRSSRGSEHTVTLPPGAQLEWLSINGATQPIRQEGSRVTLPLVPGAQSIALAFREATGIGVVFATQPIDLGAPSVNATTTVTVPGGRWLLFVHGSGVGPAVLFWSLLLVLLVASLVLGGNRWTPLRWWHWLLLGVGLSQVSVVAGAVFAGWLLVLGWRARDEGESLRAAWFNLRQCALAGWTLVALGILAVSLYQGLLGAPEMQVRGNGSDSGTLRWFVDRSGATLPRVWMISAPILVYRAAMLGWALWIALALLGWLRWGWRSVTHGGLWKRRPPTRRAAPEQPTAEAAGPPPVAGA
jgi:hypothetical protein